MCKIGLFDYMKQVGTVKVHEQGTLSNTRYNELKSAGKMIKNFIKGSSLKVDIYDAQTVPSDKFVYAKQPDSVFVEVTDLLNDKVQTAEFFDKFGEEPVLRRLFKFIDKADGSIELPIEKMKNNTIAKYNHFIKKCSINIEKIMS